MKNNNRITGLFFAMLLIVTSFSSCRKEEEEAPITTDDAADVVTYAMQKSSGGYASESEEAAAYMTDADLQTTTPTLQCGIPFDSTVTLNYSTSNVTASYTLSWDLLLSCNNQNVPQSLSFNSPYSGSYSGPLMSSSNTGNLTWTVTGLGSGSSTPYSFSGTFTRNGSHTSNVRNKTTFSSDLQVTVTAVTIDKVTQHITGGTGTVSLNCQTSTGKSYTFTGTIVFNSNGTATLTINGTPYSINLY